MGTSPSSTFSRRFTSLPAAMKHLLIISLVAFTVCQAVSSASLVLDSQWENYKVAFAKQYSSEEEHQYRKNAFAANVEFVQKHNAEHALGLHTYTVGLNKFSDLTAEEFKQKYLSSMPMMSAVERISTDPMVTIPETINWVEKGYVTEVKDQDDQNGTYVACAACWAFSATGTMEAAHFGQTGELISLSEQNLIDCATESPNAGCSGGYPSIGINHVIKSGGIESEKSYPFEAEDDVCRFDNSKVVAKFTVVQGVEQYNEKELEYGVGTFGPFSTCIDASGQGFMQYKSGIYSNPDCSRDDLDHAVLTVGYGTEHGKDYWLIKNSWGAYWGDNGYIKMARNKDNMCGIASNAVIAIA